MPKLSRIGKPTDMTIKNEVNILRQALESRLAALQAEAQAARLDRESSVDQPDSRDTKDLADRLQFDEIESVQGDRNLQDIRATEAALQRMAAGTYGACARCGEAIDVSRLRLLPTALHCTTCQQALESGEG